jgi:diguanylate cyclase (GGDEF)-like protein/PAS domain S-box-containing protein
VLQAECCVLWLPCDAPRTLERAATFGDDELGVFLHDALARGSLPIRGARPAHLVVALDSDAPLAGALAVLRRRGAFAQCELDMLSGLADILAMRLRTLEAESGTDREYADSQLRDTYEAIACGITVWSPDGALLEYNHIAEELMRVQMQPLLGKPLVETIRVLREDGTEAPAQERRVLAAARTGKATRNYYTTVASPDGGPPSFMQMSAVPVFDDNGTVTRVVCSFFDISERKRAEERLAHQATHDPLTDLPNRMLLMDRLQQSMELARRSNGSFALLLLDLDGFKEVNDRYGHHIGDRLLCEVGKRWSDRLRACDTLARLGGDEFAVLLSPADRHAAEVVSAALRASLQAEFRVETAAVQVGASIGSAVFPADGVTADALLQAADDAMYREKPHPAIKQWREWQAP